MCALRLLERKADDATIEIVLVLVVVLERVVGVASILRTGAQIDFCPEGTDFIPKGLQDSARGFNLGYG